eukprot:scaffold17639_cov108-Isochrysis_galbana.AAC.1
MVQPVINEMFATVHAAGSSLLGLFNSCSTFDSTSLKPNLAPSVTRPSFDSAGTRRPVWSVSSTEAGGFLSGRGLLEIDVLVRPSPMPRAEHCEGGRGKGGERVPSALSA